MPQARKAKLQTILSEFLLNTMNGIIVFDGNDKIIFCNNSAAKIYGYKNKLELENLLKSPHLLASPLILHLKKA